MFFFCLHMILHMLNFFKKLSLIATEIQGQISSETAIELKTIPATIYQKHAGAKNSLLEWWLINLKCGQEKKKKKNVTKVLGVNN